jgi:transposase InsO family protein
MRTTLVLDALRIALGQRRSGADVALVHHSDRGSQYTSIDDTQTLADHGVLASVGSVGDAYDNALAESFVDSFKTELSPTASGATARSSSSPSSSTSAGSTTTACTKHSATSHGPRRKPSTLPGPRPISLSKSREEAN